MQMSAAVLVVEDDPFIRLAAIATIEGAGYETLEAASADEAIRILATRTDVRLVFTDIDMPGSMDGLKLAAAIRDRWPPIRIIVTSGHSRPADGDLPSDSVFFTKPYAPDQVTQTIRALLY